MISNLRIQTLLFTDVVKSADLKARLPAELSGRLLQNQAEIFKSCLPESGAQLLENPGDGLYASFDSASAAVRTALLFQWKLEQVTWRPERICVRIGLHVGEVTFFPDAVTGAEKPYGSAVDIAARVMSMAAPNQTLMTKEVSALARRSLRTHPAAESEETALQLKFLSHGCFRFKGDRVDEDGDDPLEILEAGTEGLAPFTAPGRTEKCWMCDDSGQAVTGWRPSVGQEIPGRPGWILEECLGEGGFGEAWLAREPRRREERVFKFCFDAQRARSFRREEKLFMVLRDSLGDRSDIARIHELRREDPPYWIESDYLAGGNLLQWAERRHSGLDKVPLTLRLSLMAQLCRTLHAAHSAGVVHKDIKPGNVLIRCDADGQPHPVLADFGIGVLTDTGLLGRKNMTEGGFTEPLLTMNQSSRTGTRLYSAPEYLAGKAPSVAGDVYALGVMLYQVVMGDASRPLGQRWERGVADLFLRDDISAAVDGDEQFRLASAGELAVRLESLDARREAALSAEQKEKRVATLKAMRRKVLVFGGLAVLALLVAGGTWWLWRRAEDARQSTKAARDDAAGLVNRLFEMRDDLRLLARLDILDKPAAAAAAYLDHLPPGSMDARSHAQAAVLARHLGELAQLRGRNADAATFFERAVNLARSGYAQSQGLEQAAALSAALLPAADLRFAMNSGDAGSLALCEEVLTLSAAILTANGEHPEGLRLRAGALERIGWADRTLLRLEPAGARLNEALTLSRKVAALRPDDQAAWRQQWVVIAKLADNLKMQRRFPEAETLLREVRNVFLAKAKAAPASLVWAQDVINFQDRLADLLADAGTLPPALELQQDNLARWTALRSSAAKDDVRIIRGMSAAHEKIGRLLLETGKADEAAPHIDACLQSAGKRVQSDKPDESTIRDAVIAHELAGRLAMARAEKSDAAVGGRLRQEALVHFRQSLTFAERLAAPAEKPKSPDATIYQRLYLAGSLWRLGKCEAVTPPSPPDGGVARIRRALAILREVQRSANGILPPSRSTWEKEMEADLARLTPPP